MASSANFDELGEPIHGGRAIAAILDGKTIGIAGYYLDNGRIVVYSKITPTLRLHKRTIIRGAMIIAGMVDSVQAPALALAEEGTVGAEALLEHIGFERLDGRIYGRAPWRRQVH